MNVNEDTSKFLPPKRQLKYAVLQLTSVFPWALRIRFDLFNWKIKGNKIAIPMGKGFEVL